MKLDIKPILTIGLPFYNNKSTLELALKSVFGQTFKNWELILINDGSTDGSLEIAESITDARVRLISDGENKGLIHRLNQIAQLATGEYLARMDADDLMDPTRIEKQMEVLQTYPDVDLVDTGTYSIDENGVPVGKRGLSEIKYDARQVLKSAMLLHASIVGKRKWFRENPYDDNYTRAEDYELWCRTFRHSNFVRIKEPLYIVREGRVNIRNYEKSSETIRKIFRRYGPDILSPAELKIELFKSHLKVLVYRIFTLFNQHHYLSQKRNIPLSEAEKEDVGIILRKIQAVNII